MRKGGKLIILDVSNRNIFPTLGLNNPFEKNIEWFKHRSPEYWAELLSQCGFGAPKISWPSGRLLRYFGIGSRNKTIAYLLDSAFRLEMICDK